MRYRGRRAAELIVVSAAVALSDCGNTTIRGGCGSDSACSDGLHCVQGSCICTSDTDCPSGQSCNSAGFCQSNLGCQTSLDCPQGTFCDTTSGNCIDNSHCTEDIQCSPGQVCNTISFTCVNGCRDVGDCPLGDVCECPPGKTCSATQLLSCIQGPCGDDSYCAYGETCVAEFDGGPKSCVVDTRGPFCQSCTIDPGEADSCAGETPNFCLVDTSVTFGAEFCGVDCSKGQECPSGFECDDVLILTTATCGSTGLTCPAVTAYCTTDQDCVNQRGGQCDTLTGKCACIRDADCPGGTCDPVSGECISSCVVGEGQQQGFCTCLEDSDCPQDTCDSQNQRCVIQDTACDPTVSGTCPPIFCKKVADPLSGAVIGSCYIGQNCAPVNGVTCSQVLSTAP